MKAVSAIVLCVGVIASVCSGAAAGNGPARSLVSRMLDAREQFRPPARAMRFAADAGLDAAKWPFDVSRVEGLLARVLVKDESGAYVLKNADPGAGGGTARARSAAALSYVNKVIADWAVMQLDLKYERCGIKTVKALAGYRVDLDPDFWDKFAINTKKGLHGGGAARVGGWIAGWKLADRAYLLLTNDLTSEGCPRDYQFVMWNGEKDWPVAGFDSFPDAIRALTVLRVMESAAAANNLVALLHARDANRRLYMPEYLESLLRRSAAGGCEDAFHNLGVLMEEEGDLEQARAFFSRERDRAE